MSLRMWRTRIDSIAAYGRAMGSSPRDSGPAPDRSPDRRQDPPGYDRPGALRARGRHRAPASTSRMADRALLEPAGPPSLGFPTADALADALRHRSQLLAAAHRSVHGAPAQRRRLVRARLRAAALVAGPRGRDHPRPDLHADPQSVPRPGARRAHDASGEALRAAGGGHPVRLGGDQVTHRGPAWSRPGQGHGYPVR